MAGLGDVHLVPGPPLAAFFGVPRVQVIRRDQAGSSRREALLVPPPDHLLPALACLQVKLLDPDPAQRLDRGQAGQPARRILVVDLPQQVVAVPAVPHGQVRSPGLAVRQPEPIDPLPVDLLPGRVDHPGQPARRRGGQRLRRSRTTGADEARRGDRNPVRRELARKQRGGEGAAANIAVTDYEYGDRVQRGETGPRLPAPARVQQPIRSVAQRARNRIHQQVTHGSSREIRRAAALPDAR